MSIGKVIRNARLRQHMRQEDLAEGLCDRSYISLLENDRTTPSLEVLKLIFGRLDLDITLAIPELVSPNHRNLLSQVRWHIRRNEISVAYNLSSALWFDSAVPVQDGLLRNLVEAWEIPCKLYTLEDYSLFQTLFYHALHHHSADIVVRVGTMLQNQMFRANRFSEAVSLGQFLLTLSEGNPEQRVRIAVTNGSGALRQHKFELALELYDQSHGGTMPLLWTGWVSHGKSAAHIFLQDWNRALVEVDRAIAAYGLADAEKCMDATQNKAIILRSLGRFDESRRLFFRALEYWEHKDAAKSMDILDDMRVLEQVCDNPIGLQWVAGMIARVRNASIGE